VTSWPGITTGNTGRGGLQFSYGRVELGHLHGSSFADLPGDVEDVIGLFRMNYDRARERVERNIARR
jgi:hypothetical protein